MKNTIKKIIETMAEIPGLLFVLLVVWPCKAIYEGWMLSVFRQYCKRVKDSADKTD